MNFLTKANVAVAILLVVPSLVFAQDATKKKAYYFYGEQCPHCHKVDEYFKANGIYDKYEIQKIEISSPFNQKLFIDFGKAFGKESEWGGVPTIVFGDKYLVGDVPIIDNFVSEIDAAENASEFPSPEKIGKTGEAGTENQSSQPSESEDGNKKDYFPVVILALVAAGAGALIFVNRKKNNSNGE